MSQAVITKAFSEWKAQQAVNNQPVTLDEFIFAYIPDLDVTKPIDNTEGIPSADKIVHRQAVSKSGVVNANSVVYSVTLGANVGDFSFNWIGLINKATSTLAMIIHAPTQSKVKNASGQQGNVLVRSMLMEYSGAVSATQITTSAETWQIDFTARLASMDERQRLENIDLYGAAAFFDTGYLVAKSGTQYFVTKGAGYVAGLRAELAANQNITVSTKPVKIWLDVAWSGTLTSEWKVQSKITVAASLSDYAENGVQHHVFALASIDASGNITDLRPKGTLNEQAASDALKKHEQSRNHPDATTLAKGFVQLSSTTDSSSESLAATPKAVKTVNDDLQKVKQTLGTAASCDVTASRYDATSGRVLQVGDYGLGTTVGLSLLSSIFDITCSAKYAALGVGAGNSATEGMPANSGNTRFSVDVDSIYTNQYWVTLRSSNQSYVGMINTSAKTATWSQLYSTAFKPTAGDVGALPTTGGTLTGLLTISNPTPYIALRATGSDTRRYIMGFNSDGSSSFYVGKANANSESCMLWNYTPGSGIEITPDGRININSKGRVSVFNTDGTFVPAAWTNFDARYLALSGGTVTGATTFSSTLNIRAGLELYAPQPYIDFHFGNSSADYTARIIENTSGNLYVIGSLSASKTITPSDYSNFDARYQAKGSYTPAGEAYTKAESNARFLQGWRLSAVATATNGNNDNLFAEAPNGSVVVSVQQKTNYTAVKYRYAQYNLNGTWYNAGVAA